MIPGQHADFTRRIRRGTWNPRGTFSALDPGPPGCEGHQGQSHFPCPAPAPSSPASSPPAGLWRLPFPVSSCPLLSGPDTSLCRAAAGSALPARHPPLSPSSHKALPPPGGQGAAPLQLPTWWGSPGRGRVSNSRPGRHHLLAMGSWARDRVSSCLSLPRCRWCRERPPALGCFKNHAGRCRKEV